MWQYFQYVLKVWNRVPAKSENIHFHRNSKWFALESWCIKVKWGSEVKRWWWVLSASVRQLTTNYNPNSRGSVPLSSLFLVPAHAWYIFTQTLQTIIKKIMWATIVSGLLLIVVCGYLPSAKITQTLYKKVEAVILLRWDSKCLNYMSTCYRSKVWENFSQ